MVSPMNQGCYTQAATHYTHTYRCINAGSFLVALPNSLLVEARFDTTAREHKHIINHR